MKFADTEQGLYRAIDCLKPITQSNRIEVNSGDREISWKNRLKGINKGVYYPVEYQYLVDNHQYSLLLTDGSFFQFYYEFDKDMQLLLGRLAYYPHPSPTSEALETLEEAAEAAFDAEDTDLSDHLFNRLDLLEKSGTTISNTSHIRFDYDKDVEVHDKAHLQLGAIQELRVPASFYPLPVAFIELVSNLLAGIGVIPAADISHAKNKYLSLKKVEKVISLRM